MGIIASKGDNNTPLLNLCKERKELIKGARDARYHLAKSHLLYFRSLLDFSNALNQFVHQDLIVIPYSSDDESSSDLVCSDSGSDSDSDSDTDCLVCDKSQTAPLRNKDDNQKPQKPACGDGTCGSSKGMEKSKEGLGFEEKEFVSAPIEDERKGSQNLSSVEHETFSGYDILGLFSPVYNTQCAFIEPEQNQRDEVESDGYREIREREGIPDLEFDSDDHNSLIRKNQKKKKTKKKTKKKSVKESSSVSSESNKEDVEAKTCNVQVVDEVDNSNETCEQEETEQNTPEIVIEEVTISDDEEEVCDETYESSSSESSCSGLSDLRNVVKRISIISEKAVMSSNSEVSGLLEVNRVVHQQPLGSSPFKGFASRVLGSSGNSVRRNLLLKRGLREDEIAGSLSMTLEKLYMWETKLHEEVAVEEKLRVSYEKEFKILRDLDQNGGEPDEIDEARAMVRHQSSKVNVSVRAIESVSMRVHKIRDEELFFEVIKIINGFKEMWRFLAKCHNKQFLAAGRSKSCVHIVEKGSSSRKATKRVEDQIRSYRDSLRGYIDAERGFVKLLNEWLSRNIMEEEDDETEIEAPQIFRVCNEWLREIESVDEIKMLSAVEEMRLRFLGLGLKQVEEKKQRMRTERLCKELEKKTKELEEIYGTSLLFPARVSDPAEVELLFLRESVSQEREKHEKVIRELNDAVSMCLQESLVPIFEGLKDFCFDSFKAYQNIVIVSTEAL